MPVFRRIERATVEPEEDATIRQAHAGGPCVTSRFAADGAGTTVSRASPFVNGTVPGASRLSDNIVEMGTATMASRRHSGQPCRPRTASSRVGLPVRAFTGEMGAVGLADGPTRIEHETKCASLPALCAGAAHGFGVAISGSAISAK